MDANQEGHMAPAELDERLSRIATRWTVVFQAHGQAATAAEAARHRLMLRYSAAAYRYLLGAIRDPDVASDLCQEFAVRFLRGDFRRADPGRGRFRDYVKRALVHLVTDHHRARQAGPVQIAADAPEPAHTLGDEPDFAEGWRQDVLDQTWKALADDNPTFHAALLLRIDNPDMQSPEMAERLTAELGKPMSPENVRKTLQRAQAKFADLLLDQVSDSLDDPATDLEAELRDLDLLKYCRSALERRKK
jgi:DNA-directed RNA polymerase specialized sigma24 family protein